MKFLSILFALLPVGLFVGAFYVPMEYADYMLIASPFALAFAVYFEVKMVKTEYKSSFISNYSTSKAKSKDDDSGKLNAFPGEEKIKDSDHAAQSSKLIEVDEVIETPEVSKPAEVIIEDDEKIVIEFESDQFSAPDSPSFDSNPNILWDDGYEFDK